MPFLCTHLQNWSRSKIKQRLKSGCVSINGIPTTQHDQPLAVGDNIEVGAVPKVIHGNTQLEILHEDHDLIVINKPAGLLSVASDKERKVHALAMLREQLSRRSKEVKLWPVHRIDRDTSGVLIFATSREVRESAIAAWDKARKFYLAIVEGTPVPASGIIKEPLRQDPTLYCVHVGEHPDARPATTHYSTERSTGTRTLLDVQLNSSRQHQIRAHLAWLGHPVIGDERYGTIGPRMGLHALRLTMEHPSSGKPLTFETPAPVDFLALLKK